MARLRLRHHERPVLLRDLAELGRFLAGDVDRALARELDVIEIEHLVVEALERAFGERDQPHREIEAREPRCGLHQM